MIKRICNVYEIIESHELDIDYVWRQRRGRIAMAQKDGDRPQTMTKRTLRGLNPPD